MIVELRCIVCTVPAGYHVVGELTGVALGPYCLKHADEIQASVIAKGLKI